MPIELFWPTPIYYSKFDGGAKLFAEINNELDSAINNLDWNNPWNCDVKTSLFYGKVNNVMNDTPRFRKYVEKHIESFINRKDFYIFDSWINIYKNGSYQEYHNHCTKDVHLIISGCYYHQTSTKDGNIVFKSDSTGLKNCPILKYEDVQYQPEIGKLILFPSFLEHAVTQNKTEHERISVSFNVSLKQG